MATEALLLVDRNAGEPPLVQELPEQDVPRLGPSGLVEPAREDPQGILVDQAEPLVQHHEDPVDVDVPEGEGDLEEIADVRSEEDLAENAGALLVGAIAERRHRGVLPDEGDAPAFQIARRLDGSQDGHYEAPEGARHHVLIAPAPLEPGPHENGPPREDR